jgi:predicted metal-dependent phosphoesterase TrpH
VSQSRFQEPASEMVSPRRNRVDLHSHTNRSDGVLEPLALYEQMRAFGLRLAAISDHDTLSGYRELRRDGKGATAGPDGPQLIPAVEINSVADDELVEVTPQSIRLRKKILRQSARPKRREETME